MLKLNFLHATFHKINRMNSKTKLPFGHKRNQYFAAVSANIVMLGFGCAIGWLSPALPWLQSSDTPLLSGPLTTEQTSWSGSIICLGGMAGNILFSALTLRIGAKMTLLSLACPQMASWICMYFGDVAEHIYASRFLSGLAGGGVQTTMMLYLSQIADDDIRGILGTTSQLTRCVGTLMAYILGAYMNYVQLSLVFIGVTMLFTISFYGKPSTPQYFLKNGAIKDAENAFRYYKGFKPNQSCTQLQAAFERIQTISIESKETHDSSLKMIICDPVARKGAIIAIMLALLGHTSGNFVFLTYASTIFAESGSNLSANASSIILAIVQIAGTLVAANFIETQGRKLLLVVSLAGCSFGTFTMAAYLYCDSLAYDMSMFTWVPVTSMAFVIFISSVGIVPLGSICTIEVLPTNVRTIGLTIGMISMNIFAFAITNTFPILIEIIQLYGCMTILGGFCTFGIFFVAICMDETKGKTIDLMNEEKVSKSIENL